MIEVTKELILSLKSERGGYTKASLKKIGVSWPLKSGWKQRAIGTFVPDFRANEKLAFVPAINASESGLTFRFEMTAFEIPEKPTARSAKSAKSQKPDHFPDVRNKVDEKKLESLWRNGKQAWVDIPCTVGWVESIRDDPDHFVGVSNMVDEKAWESLWEKGGHEWITECTPLESTEDDPENPPWKS